MKLAANLLPGWRLVALAAIIAMCVSVGSYLGRPSELRIDGRGVASDVPPVTRAHEAYVPLRALSDWLGAQIDYDQRSGVIAIVNGTEHYHLRVGDRAATHNGDKIVLDSAPFTVRGRAMVSRDVIARVFSSRLNYDPARHRVDVTTPSMIEAGAQEPPGP